MNIFFYFASIRGSTHKWISLTALLLLAFPAFAQSKENISEEGPNTSVEKNGSQCQKPKTTKALVTCALAFHPKLQVLYAERKREAAKRDLAGQIPNLELDTRILYGSDSYGAEVDLRHTFELGGKRHARIVRAKQNLSVFDKKLLLKKQEVVIELLVSLHRLRQLKHEIDLIAESSRTYQSVRRRFRRLPLLNPDQEMSANIYLFAISENRQHLRILKNEYISIEEKIRLMIANSELSLSALLPKPLRMWPKVAHRSVKDSPFLRHAQSRIAASKAELELQDSLAWPNFSIGPSLDYRRDRSDLPAYLGGGSSRTATELGASFSFTIPLYHQNQGGRKVAKRDVEARQVAAEVMKTKLDIWRRSLVKIYNKSVASLNVPGMERLLASKHRRLHQLLRRGIVHSSLVIELHRQEYEYVRSSHENELAALRTLFEIRAIDGEIFREAQDTEKKPEEQEKSQ